MIIGKHSYFQNTSLQQYNFMADFLQVDGQHAIFRNLFNEEHTNELLSSLQGPLTSLQFHNVGVKVMRLIISALSQAEIRSITVNYDWNVIMTTPQLVCYDKTQWKTIQQLTNWNREWSELFFPSYFLSNVQLNVRCSWMDDKFAKELLGGLSKLPNISAVSVELSSKSQEVGDVLAAVQKAGIFQQYKYNFQLQK